MSGLIKPCDRAAGRILVGIVLFCLVAGLYCSARS